MRSMVVDFSIPNSDTTLLNKAKSIAEEYARSHITENTVGIVFLGAVARGYFDQDSDIDIAIFEQSGAGETEIRTELVSGIELQTFVSDFETESTREWEMSKRWAYSQRIVFFDKGFATENLLARKVPLKTDERKRLMLSGIALSEWYCHRLTALWLRRGDPFSAHSMFNEGLNHYLSALYSLNGELVADYKWRFYCARKLAFTPSDFEKRLAEVMRMEDASPEEIERRAGEFMGIWNDTLPRIESEVGMKYNDFKDLV